MVDTTEHNVARTDPDVRTSRTTLSEPVGRRPGSMTRIRTWKAAVLAGVIAIGSFGIGYALAYGDDGAGTTGISMMQQHQNAVAPPNTAAIFSTSAPAS